MRFALLGLDPQTASLAWAIARHDRHQLTAACEIEGDTDKLRRLSPALETAAPWESLLGAGDVDAVIVAAAEDQERRAEQLRKLAGQGVPMLIAHPVHASVLVYYELDMIRQDSHGPMVPLLAGRLHPAVARIRELTTASAGDGLGAIEQVVIDRAVADRSSTSVLQHFVRDVDLAAALVGDLTGISAMTSAGRADDYANLAVQMSSRTGALVRWSVAGLESGEGARVTLHTSAGQAVLQTPSGDAPWRLTTTRSGHHDEERFAEWDAAAAMLDHFVRLVEGSRSPPTWNDAVRSMELADSIELSLRRGRTIALHHGRATEEGTFKGMMASAGCGLLILGLLVTFGGLLLIWLEVPGAFAWPYVILGLFVVFLLLQLLKLVFARDRE